MRLGRLFRMGIPELACRGRQEVSKWLERAGVARSTNGRPPRRFAPEGSKGFSTARFFEGAVGHQTPALISEYMPWIRDQVVVAADVLCRGRFDLLGYGELFFGDPVDWHLNPISGRRAPLVHWSRLNPLDSSAVGDSKVIWELNRHQWTVRLAQAYRLTGDERYVEVFCGYLRQWMRANPPGMGINWASSLEVALRLIAWCWALSLFRESATLSPELLAQMRESIRAHATHLERYLSYYFSPNTHLTGEALGLFYAGLLFPELPRSERWRTLGARILVDQSERQVFHDGVYVEQSTCYQCYTVEIYLHFLILAARNGMAIPTAVEERVQRMLHFLLAIRSPHGSMPQIGDADGGWLLPLSPRAPGDLRGIFSTAAAFFDRPEYAWAAEGLAPETLWLLGPSGLKGFEALAPAPPPTVPSLLFAEGGYAVMRSGWEADAHHLIFDSGPLGCPVSGGHGHADLLSVQCSVFGDPCLVDAGTFCYTADPDWRDFFRSAAAHSTVTVDNAGQAVPAGAFQWEMRPRARLRQWVSTEAFDFADAEHDAYAHLSDPVGHRRRVLFVKPRYWVLVDDLQGAAEHRVELRFQFAPMQVTLGPALSARAHGPRGRGLLIRSFAAVPVKAEVFEGGTGPIQGWVSPVYGQRRPAPILVYSTVTRLPLRIVTLLFPLEDLLAAPPTVSPIPGKDGGLTGLAFEEGQEHIRFDGGNVVVTRVLDPGREGGVRLVPPANTMPSATGFRTSATYSDWDVYRFGLMVGLRTLPVAPFEGFKRLILPVEYVRCAEFRYVLGHLDVTADHLVLDIGSPKLLSLFLAARVGATVYATDLLDYFFQSYGVYADTILGPSRERFRMEPQDARALAYPSDSFDRVFSVSTIEHIPDQGDGAAMREIARVLKPGGVCCLTVPWSDSGYMEVFKGRGDPDAYWVTSNDEKVFYQRLYDWDTLEGRLLNHRSLETIDVSFCGERRVPVEHVLLDRKLPRLLRYAMLPLHFPLSRLFLRPVTQEEPSRKKVACLTLRKPRR